MIRPLMLCLSGALVLSACAQPPAPEPIRPEPVFTKYDSGTGGGGGCVGGLPGTAGSGDCDPGCGSINADGDTVCLPTTTRRQVDRNGGGGGGGRPGTSTPGTAAPGGFP